MRSFLTCGTAMMGAWMLTIVQVSIVSAHEGETRAQAGTSIGWIGEIGVIVVFGLCAWLMLRSHWVPADGDQEPGEERGR